MGESGILLLIFLLLLGSILAVSIVLIRKAERERDEALQHVADARTDFLSRISNDIKTCCVYFGNLVHSSGAIVHQGDNLTGAGDGDDEQIMVDLPNIPANIDKLVFVVNIYDANVRHQHFGLIRNAFIRLVDLSTQKEICRFNLSDDYSGRTGLVVGEIYRHNGEWKFNAIGQGVTEASRLAELVRLYQ